MQETSEGKPHVEFKRTIEARAHRSTLDADAITAWLQTVSHSFLKVVTLLIVASGHRYC